MKIMNPEEIVANFKIDVESAKLSIVGMVKLFLERVKNPNIEELVKKFSESYNSRLNENNAPNMNDLTRYYRLIQEFKPSLLTIIPLGAEFDQVCDIMVHSFNATLNRVRAQLNEQITKNELPIFKKNQPMQLKFFCTVCKETFAIPPELQAKIMNSDEKITLPQHHDKEMVIKIGEPEQNSQPIPKTQDPPQKIEVYPAELLMQHIDSAESQAEYLSLTSVGIDVGTSTTHLVFSKLKLKRERSFFNMSNRFVMVDREIIYEGRIIFTPLLNTNLIDVEGVIQYCKEEYQRAGIRSEEVDTGAVIITGETAKKNNAAKIVQQLSSESGKFVSASAGPNFESLLAAMGSGIVDISRHTQKTIMNIDIGGGTSNCAIVSKGEVISTSCINIGGRLLGIEPDLRIWRIDDPTMELFKILNMSYRVGDTISPEDLDRLVEVYAKALVEIMQHPAQTQISNILMMTDDLDYSTLIDQVAFSGGVAEMIYTIYEDPEVVKELFTKWDQEYRDIGWRLANKIVQIMQKQGIELCESTTKIRATVIGAGAFSLSVSGSTCYVDLDVPLPFTNIPVISINTEFHNIFSSGGVGLHRFRETVTNGVRNYNLEEGKDLYALYFADLNLRANFETFAEYLAMVFPNSVKNNHPIIILLGFDGAKILGLTLRQRTEIKTNFMCLDELELETGDWIDIGNPLQESEAYPVTIKSLVFNRKIAEGKTEGKNIQKDERHEIDEVNKINELNEPSSESSQIFLSEKVAIFQQDHDGFDEIFILDPQNHVLFPAPESSLIENIKMIIESWNIKEAMFYRNDRYPFVRKDESQFIAKNISKKLILIGYKMKSGHQIITKILPGTQWQPESPQCVCKTLSIGVPLCSNFFVSINSFLGKDRPPHGMNKKKCFSIVGGLVIVFILLNLPNLLWPEPENILISRSEAIPDTQVKITPETDMHPPVLDSAFASIWEDPIPMPGPINTAGAEDSPYILSDGNTFFFWFTPDMTKSPGETVNDGATGIYRTEKNGTEWKEPERVFMGWDVLDACPTCFDDQLYFCSVRQNVDMQMYVAEYNGSDYINITAISEYIGEDYSIGELHVTEDGNKIFYGTVGSDGLDYNISMIERVEGIWQTPISIDAVNTNTNAENLPFVNTDGTELWFTRQPISGGTLIGAEIYRSVWTGSDWGEPQHVVGPLCGEPTLDDAGNLYFTHHFWNDTANRMMEADIYVCYRK